MVDKTSSERLAGKVALVTGGASGIGEETCRRMVAEGARVGICDIQRDGGEALASELGEAARYVPLDVTSEAEWQEAIAGVVGAFGRLDVLVNCAGISVPTPIDELSFEGWRHTMAINADSVFLGCRAGIEAMRRTGGGSIINISSTLGVRGGSRHAAYCASKGAVRLLTKSVALRCAEEGWGIRCNSVHPGAIETPIMDPFVSEDRDREAVVAAFGAKHPMGRVGRAREVADVILFLASDESSYVTGAEIAVDGGYLA